MLSLDVFLPRLMPSLPGCPDPLVRQSLVDAAIEFCEETGLVRVTSEAQAAVAGQSAYDIDVPTQQRVCLTQRAWYGTRELIALPSASISSVLAYDTPAGADVLQGEPKFFFESAPGEISVLPTPKVSTAAMLTFRFTAKPTRAATQLDDRLFEDWVEALVAGALARLHAIPDQPFSSSAASSIRRAEFQFYIGRARSEALRGRVRSQISMSRNRFAP